MIGILPFRKTPSFSFPGTKPGVDYTHPAARGLRFSGVQRGANFVNLMRGSKGTITATITAGIDSIIGPYAKNAGTSGKIAMAGNQSKAATLGVIAAIIRTGATTPDYSTAISNTSNAVNNLSLGFLNNNLSVFSDTGGSDLDSTLPLSTNTSYFVAASFGAAGAGNCYFVATNLNTGQILQTTVANNQISTTSNGTICICGDRSGDAAIISVAAAMYAINFQNPNDLLAWANDPWSFWYPRIDLSTIIGPVTSAAKILAADAGSYTISGQTTNLLRSRLFGAGTGAYNLTAGTPATLRAGKVLATSAGSYTINGTAVGFVRAYKVIASVVTYNLTGTNAGALRGYRVQATFGSYTINGTNATLTKTAGKNIQADSGTYNIAGSNAGLLMGRRVTASTGVYNITGSDAALTITSVGGSPHHGRLAIKGRIVSSIRLGRL